MQAGCVQGSPVSCVLFPCADEFTGGRGFRRAGFINLGERGFRRAGFVNLGERGFVNLGGRVSSTSAGGFRQPQWAGFVNLSGRVSSTSAGGFRQPRWVGAVATVVLGSEAAVVVAQM